ncbi:MAG: hypothetical protein ACM3ME_09230 [Chloroflexota bacterium]
MKKTDIEHIQRSIFLESGQLIKTQIDKMVRSINLKYPELAVNIEIPNGITNQSSISKVSGSDILLNYLKIYMNRNLLA